MRNCQPLKWPLLAAGAFVVGIGGTVAVMSHRQPAPPAAAQDGNASKDADAKPDADKAADSKGLIRLTAAAVRNGGIRVETVQSAPLGEALVVPATVEASANRVAKVSPPVAGKVVGIFVNLGDWVRAGQPLAVLESLDVAQGQAAIRQAESGARQAQAQVQTALAQVQTAQGRQHSAEIAFARQTALARAGAFSQGPLQAAQSEQAQGQSELLQAQAELQNRTTILTRNQKLFTAGIVARAELEQAQADQRQSQIRVDQAQGRVALANQALAREKSVFGQGLLSQQATQSAQADVRAAQAEVHRTQTEFAGARTALMAARDAVVNAEASLRALTGSGQGVSGSGRITVFAPMAGTVTTRDATLGEAVERSSALFTLENLNSVTIQAEVGETDIARIRVGQGVTVRVPSYPAERFSGVVSSLGSAVDGKTRTLPVRCVVDNAARRLRPEMFAQVSLSTDTPRPAIVVPQAALVGDGDGEAVYVAEASGFRKRIVTVGRTVGGRVEVKNGLHVGERVVTDGAFVLKSEAGKAELKDAD